MFWCFIFWMFFIFKPVVLANNPSIVWKNGASDARRGDQFDINVELSNVSVGSTYHIKVYGGKTENSTDTSCLIDNLYNQNWLNGCGTDNNVMPYIIGNDSLTMRLRVGTSSSSGTYYLYAYVPELNLTSASRIITINDPLPTSVPTATPTPTSVPTKTPTPTKILTPTPTEAPIMEPTSSPIIEPTNVPEPVIENTTINNSSDDSKKSGSNYLPIIFIVFGLLMFIVPFLGPKIASKIKFKKQEQPPIIPPFTGLNS